MRFDRWAARVSTWCLLAMAVLFCASCSEILGLEDGVAQGACAADDDCAPGYGCLLGTCRNGCTDDSQCGAGARCLKAIGTSACIPAGEGCGRPASDGTSGEGCPAGTTCQANACRTPCTGAALCAGGQQCRDGLCVSIDSRHETDYAEAGTSAEGGPLEPDTGVRSDAGRGADVSGAGGGGAGGASGGGADASTTGQGSTGTNGTGAGGIGVGGAGGAGGGSMIADAGAAPRESGAGDARAPGVCVPGAQRSCGEDGLRGNCAKGVESCGSAGTWGACNVTAQKADSCATVGDDANCDGTVNDGCPCVASESRACGPQIAQGICKQGTQTCANAQWGTCKNAVYASARNCSSPMDNDCDGRPDNAIDSVCTCALGTMRACDTHPGYDGKGPCRAGTQTCTAANGGASSAWGSCSGGVAPLAADTCEVGNDANCNGTPNDVACACMNGATRACGDCNGGSQTCKDGSWGTCEHVPAMHVYYPDVDGDGFGNDDPKKAVEACSAPAGYVTKAGDCCDAKNGEDTYPGSKSINGCTGPNACGNYDYDCDGAEKKDHDEGACSTALDKKCWHTLTSCLLLLCEHPVGVPACGQVGSLADGKGDIATTSQCCL